MDKLWKYKTYILFRLIAGISFRSCSFSFHCFESKVDINVSYLSFPMIFGEYFRVKIPFQFLIKFICFAKSYMTLRIGTPVSDLFERLMRKLSNFQGR